MSTEPRDELSTADMVTAGQPNGRTVTTEETPGYPTREHAEDREPRAAASAERPSALLPTGEGGDLRHRWDTIQTGFVDEPRRAVKEADSLVAQTMKRVAEVFSQERESLEQQWTRGEDVSTEDLRVTLKRYRSFFDRLLAA
jgi:hypothetical protein